MPWCSVPFRTLVWPSSSPTAAADAGVSVLPLSACRSPPAPPWLAWLMLRGCGHPPPVLPPPVVFLSSFFSHLLPGLSFVRVTGSGPSLSQQAPTWAPNPNPAICSCFCPLGSEKPLGRDSGRGGGDRPCVLSEQACLPSAESMHRQASRRRPNRDMTAVLASVILNLLILEMFSFLRNCLWEPWGQCCPSQAWFLQTDLSSEDKALGLLSCLPPPPCCQGLSQPRGAVAGPLSAPACLPEEGRRTRRILTARHALRGDGLCLFTGLYPTFKRVHWAFVGFCSQKSFSKRFTETK